MTRIFASDNVPKAIEQGTPLIEYLLFANKTEEQGKIIYWLGLEQDVWLMIVNILHFTTPEGRTLAEAIASQTGLELKK